VRAVRFWSVDPITHKHPELSPYQFASNGPIEAVDEEGLESSKQDDKSQGQTPDITNLMKKLDDVLTGGEQTHNEKVQTLQNAVKQHTELLVVDQQLEQKAYSDLAKSKPGSFDEKLAIGLLKSSKASADKDLENLQLSITALYKEQRNDPSAYKDFLNKELTYTGLGFNIAATVASFIPSGGASSGLFKGVGWGFDGGMPFADYKVAWGGTETLAYIKTTNAAGQPVFQRISTEYAHVFITQRAQRALNLPNWLVNNPINVWKLNTIQHSLIDSYRFRFIRFGMKPEIGWFGKYNWFTNFSK
jgi:hypothetical protein